MQSEHVGRMSKSVISHAQFYAMVSQAIKHLRTIFLLGLAIFLLSISGSISDFNPLSASASQNVFSSSNSVHHHSALPMGIVNEEELNEETKKQSADIKCFSLFLSLSEFAFPSHAACTDCIAQGRRKRSLLASEPLYVLFHCWKNDQA